MTQNVNVIRGGSLNSAQNLPVCITVHDTRAPARGVVDKIDGSFQGLACFSHDAVTDLNGEIKRDFNMTVLSKCTAVIYM